MSKEFSELKRRLDILTNLHLRALGAFNAYETILKLLAPNVVGEVEAKGYQAAMNRYKGFFNTAKRAYEYEMLMTLARIFVAHKDALYLERLINYAEQNRKKLSVDDFKEYHEDNTYLNELAASYEGLNNDDLKAIRQDLEKMRDPIERLKEFLDMAKPVDPKLKQEILSAVKSGMPQAEASKLYGVSTVTIRTWCRQDIVGGEKNYIAQINQLKRELDNAYRVIGKLSARADRPKG